MNTFSHIESALDNLRAAAHLVQDTEVAGYIKSAIYALEYSFEEAFLEGEEDGIPIITNAPGELISTGEIGGNYTYWVYENNMLVVGIKGRNVTFHRYFKSMEGVRKAYLHIKERGQGVFFDPAKGWVKTQM